MEYCPFNITALCPATLFQNNCKDGACAAAWCHSQLDPEGVLSSFPAVLTTFIGWHFGRVIQYFPLDQTGQAGHRARFMQWIPMSLALIALGLLIEFGFGWKPNKQIWTPAYVAIMAGTNGLVLAAFYALLDFTAWQPDLMKKSKITNILRPFVWVGMNTILVYLFSPAGGATASIQAYLWWKHPDNNLLDTSFRHIVCSHVNDSHVNGSPSYEHAAGEPVCHSGMFGGSHEKYAVLFWILLRIGFWCGVAGILYRKRWFWSL
jgi:heparan-alpha-glucosaminide N-acetyltransferase